MKKLILLTLITTLNLVQNETKANPLITKHKEVYRVVGTLEKDGKIQKISSSLIIAVNKNTVDITVNKEKQTFVIDRKGKNSFSFIDQKGDNINVNISKIGFKTVLEMYGFRYVCMILKK